MLEYITFLNLQAGEFIVNYYEIRKYIQQFCTSEYILRKWSIPHGGTI